MVQIRNQWVEPLEPTLQELAATLEELANVLRPTGHRRWARYVADCRSRLRGSGLEKLMRAYGGMGSFNDLWVGEARQDRFEELKRRAYDLARQAMVRK